MEIEFEYATKIIGKIQELFEDDEMNFQIDMNDFKDNEKLTAFFHALTNVAPTMIYNRLTGDDKNHLEFNHIANQLCFQFSTKE